MIFKNDTKKLPIPPGKTLAKVPEHDTKTTYENEERGNLQCFSAKVKIALLIESRHHFDPKVLAEKICMKASYGHLGGYSLSTLFYEQVMGFFPTHLSFIKNTHDSLHLLL